MGIELKTALIGSSIIRDSLKRVHVILCVVMNSLMSVANAVVTNNETLALVLGQSAMVAAGMVALTALTGGAMKANRIVMNALVLGLVTTEEEVVGQNAMVAAGMMALTVLTGGAMKANQIAMNV